MIFSGVVACATEVSLSDTQHDPLTNRKQLPPTDLEVLSAGITALGGQWRTGLTKDTTHLFVISDSPPSQKYTTAMHFKETTGVKVLLPHWFDDAVRLGIGSLPTEEYEWPSPALLRRDPNENDEDLQKRKLAKVDGEKKLLYKSTSWVPGENPLKPESRDVWKSKRIILASSLDLHGGRRDAVRSGIVRAGGLVVGTGETEEEEVDLIENGKVDVVITRWRSGSTYSKVSTIQILSPFVSNVSLGCQKQTNYRNSGVALPCRIHRNFVSSYGSVTALSNTQESHRRFLRTRERFDLLQLTISPANDLDLRRYQ